MRTLGPYSFKCGREWPYSIGWNHYRCRNLLGSLIETLLSTYLCKSFSLKHRYLQSLSLAMRGIGSIHIGPKFNMESPFRRAWNILQISSSLRCALCKKTWRSSGASNAERSSKWWTYIWEEEWELSWHLPSKGIRIRHSRPRSH